MLYLVPPCCTYRCYMIIYYIQKAHVLGISKWRSFPAAEKLVLMLKEFAQNDLYKSSCEWMTWKSKQILTTPFFMGRGVRNLELLSGVLNRHLFVRYRPYFLGGGGVYHRCNLCLTYDANQPSLLGTFYITAGDLWKRPHRKLPSVNLWPNLATVRVVGDDRTEEGSSSIR